MFIKRPDERRSQSRSATRALDVLELFGEVQRPLRAIEIARALGMNPSTTNQLLKTMVDSAHLIFDAEAKLYRPSPRLVEFSTWIVGNYGAGSGFRELIGEVQSKTGLLVTVCTPNDLFMQVMDSRSPEGVMVQRGVRVSLFGSAIGNAYLSTLEPGELARMIDRGRIADSELPRISEELAAIRERGFAERQSADSDTWSIAVPIKNNRWNMPVVLGVSGPTEKLRARVEEFAEIMREAVRQGFADPPSQG